MHYYQQKGVWNLISRSPSSLYKDLIPRFDFVPFLLSTLKKQSLYFNTPNSIWKSISKQGLSVCRAKWMYPQVGKWRGPSITEIQKETYAWGLIRDWSGDPLQSRALANLYWQYIIHLAANSRAWARFNCVENRVQCNPLFYIHSRIYPTQLSVPNPFHLHRSVRERGISERRGKLKPMSELCQRWRISRWLDNIGCSSRSRLPQG